MSETTFVVLAAVLGPLWLAIIVTRTVLAERAAEPGVPLARPRPVRLLDLAGLVLGAVLFLALIGRMIAALA
ncbi:hypothetical protein ACFFS4_02990 [Kutzneria kofuensis]|uniref:Uncharacterized protein n=1 Tax=Kutzneria kofuensis TaxID=103725 RepID=A0A7W9NE74_9PSEU|nr:hypothetical protein [Kutzneria kofuensis]MBB5888831.1 hypothetical protein [Kutzneria kofuensis]